MTIGDSSKHMLKLTSKVAFGLVVLAVSAMNGQSPTIVSLQLSGVSPVAWLVAPGRPSCFLGSEKNFNFFSLTGAVVQINQAPFKVVPVAGSQNGEVNLQAADGSNVVCRIRDQSVDRFIVKTWTSEQRNQVMANRRSQGRHNYEAYVQ
jgi:hypothetical protein